MVKNNEQDINEPKIFVDDTSLCIAVKLVMKDFGVTKLEALSMITGNQDEILNANFGMRIMYAMFKKKADELK